MTESIVELGHDGKYVDLAHGEKCAELGHDEKYIELGHGEK
jgi:hypothetical protein